MRRLLTCTLFLLVTVMMIAPTAGAHLAVYDVAGGRELVAKTINLR